MIIDLSFDQDGEFLAVGTQKGNIHVFRIPEASGGSSLTASFMPKESLAESIMLGSEDPNTVSIQTNGSFSRINIG